MRNLVLCRNDRQCASLAIMKAHAMPTTRRPAAPDSEYSRSGWRLSLGLFLITGAAGLWSADGEAENSTLMSPSESCASVMCCSVSCTARRWLWSELGLAAAFYIPAYLAGDFAALGTGAGMLAVAVGLERLWIHRSGQP